MLKEGTKKLIQHVSINHIRHVSVEDFYNIESMGVECSPWCGGCKCSDCPLGGNSYNLKKEHELRLIEDGLKHNGDHWIAQYPWIRDPIELPANYSAALAMLEKLEKRLQKNTSHAQVYQEQVEGMISRGVARKLTKEEVEEYHGPIH